jgi:hypothetical protein
MQRLRTSLAAMPAQMADADAMARAQVQQEAIGRELGAGAGT